MSQWPKRIPFDLQKELEELERRRCPPSNQDRWLVWLRWCEKHGLEAPDKLEGHPEYPSRF